MIKAWIEAMRLRTLPVSVAGVFAAVAMNVFDGTFHLGTALLCLVFALLCQIASNFANEYYDYRAGRDRVGREGPRRGVTEGDITPRAMLLATFATLAVAAVVGLAIAAVGGWWLIAVGAVIGIGALAYSAGPWPLSAHCLGEAAVIAFFGIVPVTLTYYVQAHTVTLSVTMLSLSVGLMGANVLIVNNYRDAADDAAVGKHTLANTLGSSRMPLLYGANAILAAILSLPAWHLVTTLWYIVPLIYIAAALLISRRISRLHGAPLNPFLGRTSLLMFFYSLLLLLCALCVPA